jgi:hypothetical protein
MNAHKYYVEKLKRMTQSDRVEITHTKEQGKDDYLINQNYYFDKSITENKYQMFKTEDRADEKGKITRVIYALNKDGVPFYNFYGILRPLADDKYTTGRICLECLNVVPPIKNEYVKRLCCKICDKGEIRETIKKNLIVKIKTLG